MKIGEYSIPMYRLNKLVDATKKLDDHFRGEEMDRQGIAAILGHAPASGTLTQKIADLKSYGLIAGKMDRFTVTTLGKQVTSGNRTKENEARLKLVQNIPMWSIILDKYGTSIKQEHFEIDLRRITGVVASVAENKASEVRKAYLEDVKYIKSVGEPTETPQIEGVRTESTDRTSTMEAQLMNSEKAIVDIKYPGYSGQIEIRDKISLEIVRKLLDAIELYLKAKQKQAVSENNEPENEEDQLTEYPTNL